MARGMSSRPQLRELDALLAVGESISCALAAMAVGELGSRAVSLTGAQAGILTDGRHGDARLQDDPSPAHPRGAGRRGDRAGDRLPGDLPERRRHHAGARRFRRVGGCGRRRSRAARVRDLHRRRRGVHGRPARRAGRAAVARGRPRGDAAARRGRCRGAAAARRRARHRPRHRHPRPLELHRHGPAPGSWRRPACSRRSTSSAWLTGTGSRATPCAALSPRRSSPQRWRDAVARIGTVVRHGGEVLFTAPGMDETEVVAVLTSAGAQVARAGRARHGHRGRHGDRPAARRRGPRAAGPRARRDRPATRHQHARLRVLPRPSPAGPPPRSGCCTTCSPCTGAGERTASTVWPRGDRRPAAAGTVSDSSSTDTAFGPGSPVAPRTNVSSSVRGCRVRLEDLFASGAPGRPTTWRWTRRGLALTYAELDGRANRLARHLLAAGLGAGERVALLFDDAAQAYVAMLAVLKAGAAYVPLDPGFPADRLAYIVDDAGVGVVLSLRAPARPPGRRAARRWCASTTPRPDRRAATPARCAAAERGRADRPAGVHHLHLGVDRPPQGRGGRARAASATSCGWRPRCTASGRTTACTRA